MFDIFVLFSTGDIQRDSVTFEKKNTLKDYALYQSSGR